MPGPEDEMLPEDLEFEFEAVDDDHAIARAMLIIAAMTGETPAIINDETSD